MAAMRGRQASGVPSSDLLEQWAGMVGKAMSHPARAAILLTVARDGSASPTDAAEATAVPLATCSYHMRLLVELGAIRLRTTRPVRGAVEHIYELTADGKVAVRAIEAVLALAPAGFRRQPAPRRAARAG
jgi:predicted ArsR family transcriptional regulator